MPFGGWRMVAGALETYGYPVSEELEKVFTQYRKTHNAAVFDAYTPEIRAARKAGVVTGLPMPTGAAASSATTAAWPSTASTGSSPSRRRRRRS